MYLRNFINSEADLKNKYELEEECGTYARQRITTLAFFKNS